MLRMLHTPDGVRDCYGDELRRKKTIMARVDRVFDKYGYEPIETPVIEYFDVFSREIGTTPSNELYKFFDRDGNTLVMRPDFTPSVARAAAMYFSERERPIRLCYEGKTFVNTTEYQGRLKESTQMGVELLGDASEKADAEVIALTIESLRKAGLKEFQVSIGEVNLFRSLVKGLDMTDEQTEEIRRLISNKNFFGVEERLDGLAIPKSRKEAIVRLPQLFGGPEVLKEAHRAARGAKADGAIDRLEAIYDILKEKDLDGYVSFDFGLLSKFQYYTGIIFTAVTFGSGEPVAKGGRYDRLLGYFGKEDAAVGVGIYIDHLLTCLSRRRGGR